MNNKLKAIEEDEERKGKEKSFIWRQRKKEEKEKIGRQNLVISRSLSASSSFLLLHLFVSARRRRGCAVQWKK